MKAIGSGEQTSDLQPFVCITRPVSTSSDVDPYNHPTWHSQ